MSVGQRNSRAVPHCHRTYFAMIHSLYFTAFRATLSKHDFTLCARHDLANPKTSASARRPVTTHANLSCSLQVHYATYSAKGGAENIDLSILYGFGGLVVSMLASGSRVRGFDPDRSRWIFFPMWKNPQHAFLRRGSKIICPMSQLWGM
jgi:hypothetical protein